MAARIDDLLVLGQNISKTDLAKYLRDREAVLPFDFGGLGDGAANDRAAIQAHFGKWVAEHSASGASAVRKGGGFTLSASSRDGAWHLDVDSQNVRATTIVIRQIPQAVR
jgi:hypothetical protein